VEPSRHRRQVFLFLVAIIVPCLVLVYLSLRIISQDRELAEKRLAEDRNRLVRELHYELLTHLENIKKQQVSEIEAQPGQAIPVDFDNPAVALVARAEEGRLILPWDENRNREEFRRLLDTPAFRSKIDQGEQQEFILNRFEDAAELYQEAVRSAQHPAQAAYGRLLLARALAKSGREDEALAQYLSILQLSFSEIDEHGIPLALYAADRLVKAGQSWEAVLERLAVEIEAEGWLCPAADNLLHDLTVKCAEEAEDARVREQARNIRRRIVERMDNMGRALALQSEFINLNLISTGRDPSENSEPLWIPCADDTWLVSAGALSGTQSVVVAVDAQKVLASLRSLPGLASTFSGDLKFFTDWEQEGDLLGPNFPGLKVSFSTEEDATLAVKSKTQHYFYLGALLLVVCVTLFGAYLLWRDVRREVQLAQMRSQFVSSLSHELKTPLTSIRMFAETLQIGHAGDRQKQNEYLETIVGESERLTRLLNNVLDFSKIEQGKKIYRFETISLPEVVQTAARAIQYPLTQQGFELHLDIEEDLPPVRADADAIEQAILNLLTNAMKYSGENRQIRLRLLRHAGRAVIEVTDYGVGIHPDAQERIFEKFYRAPTPENQQIPGTGLGLTLVAHITNAHSGHVEMQSAPGEGSSFSIYLPLEEET